MRQLSQAERILQSLGVTDPREIDLDAIAYHMNALVRYRKLDGCEARIMGAGDRAIISVSDASMQRRQRFSIAHELGHWTHHRGKQLACRAEESYSDKTKQHEREANRFASDMLLPRYLFDPVSKDHQKFNFTTVKSVADVFDASKSAVARRLVECEHTPSLLICHGPSGRKWFVRSPSVPHHWFPQYDLDSESFAFDVQFGGKSDNPTMRKIGADAWFDARAANRFEVREQTIRVSDQDTLTLIEILDEDMLSDRF